jgi:type II secretory pathway component PulJ
MIVGCRRDQGGATLIEQLIALLIGSALITCLYGYFRAELYHTLAVEAKTASLEDARGALDIIIRDLRNAGSWGSGSVPSEIGATDDPNNDSDTVCNRVYAATASLIHVQMDLNGNGNCADSDPRENIRYELAGPTSTCPGPNTIRRNGDCLVANIVPATAGKVFSYYDAKGTDLGNAPPRDAIKRVKISFSVRVKNPDPKVTSSLASIVSGSVEFRN